MNKTLFFLLSGFMIISWSCKKKTDPPVVPPKQEQCLLTSIQNNYTGFQYSQRFDYDDQGRVISTDGNYFGNLKYFYSQNEITVKGFNGVVLQTYELDQQGRIINRKDLTQKEWLNYVYNADGYLTRINFMDFDNGQITDSVFMTYSDGNLVKTSSGTEVIATFQYTKSLARDNNYLTLDGHLPAAGVAPMLQRYLGKQSKNLVGFGIYQCPALGPGDDCGEYSMDAKGNIKENRISMRLNMESGNADFEYKCK